MNYIPDYIDEKLPQLVEIPVATSTTKDETDVETAELSTETKQLIENVREIADKMDTVIAQETEDASALQLKRVMTRPRDNSLNLPVQLETKVTDIPLPGDSRCWIAPMLFEGQLLMFLLDTGSNVSIINAKTYESRYKDRQLGEWLGNINHAGNEPYEYWDACQDAFSLPKQICHMILMLQKCVGQTPYLVWIF